MNGLRVLILVEAILVTLAALIGLLYTLRLLTHARLNWTILTRKKRNGARRIIAWGRIRQERLATAVQLAYLLAGAAFLFAPPGWLRLIVAPLLVLGIVLTALKSFYREQDRNRAVSYLDSTIPDHAPLEILDQLDLEGNVERG